MLKLIILYCLFILSLGYNGLISIKPGGLKGFYVLGICKYIKENYCLEDYYFYGSSAGSWNTIYLTLPFDIFIAPNLAGGLTAVNVIIFFFCL